MNSERLAERARRHAALGDPARLRIVDLLTVSDRSPGELQSDLEISSNLLAHHLNTLEDAGLVTRSKSEGDRRRSYVRLTADALLGLDAAEPMPAARVVFVCTANSARSQLAAALWRAHSAVPVASAGTHPAARIEPAAAAAAHRHGLDLGSAIPLHLDEVLRAGDYVVTVCDNAHEELGASNAHWSIPDPVRSTTPHAFESSYTLLERRVGEFAGRVRAA